MEETILAENAMQIAVQMARQVVLVELGSGNAVKTRHLLEAFLRKQGSLQYVPIDVSRAILDETCQTLCRDYPALCVLGIAATYQEGLPIVAQEIDCPKLIVWLGSDIGQMSPTQAGEFLKTVKSIMGHQDGILVSIDLKKETNELEAAYGSQDAQGTLRDRFVKNMLVRINRELGGHFDLDAFARSSFYNEDEGCIEVHLVSLRQQQVPIDSLSFTADFAEREAMRIHRSYKYSMADIYTLAQTAGLQVKRQWLDAQQWFSVNLIGVA
jgi:L-histidine N-alpha-methyltransferase